MNTNLKEEKEVTLNTETKEWLIALLEQTICNSYNNRENILSEISIQDFILGAYEIAKDIMMSCNEDSYDNEEQIKLDKFAQIVIELEEYI